MDFPWDKLRARTVDGIPDLYLAIAQDAKTDEVLMCAFINRRAIELTIKSGVMHYYSTSRKKIWRKGEQSGNEQRVVEFLIDCDGDAILFKVDQLGGACHKGYRSCFFTKIDLSGNLSVIDKKIFDPDQVYDSK